MKILQINSVYRKGSTGKIVHDLHSELLRRGDTSLVCYGRGKAVSAPGVYRIPGQWRAYANHAQAFLTGRRYACPFSNGAVEAFIRRERPDVVHLHCLNDYYVNVYELISFLKRERIPTVLTLHAEFMYTANCGYALDCERWRTGCGDCPHKRGATDSLLVDFSAASWQRMKEAFDGFDTLQVVSVSPWIMERAMQSPILAGKNHTTVYNGLDTQIFRPRCEKPGAGKTILHVTSSFNRDPEHLKGGYYVAELARKMPEVRFLVAGASERAENDPANLEFLGNVEDQKRLAELYSQADLTLLTSRKEAFSMVCAESLCCGTPVVGFRAGAPERITLPEYSAFCEPGDLESLERAVREWLGKTPDRTALAEQAAACYSKEEMFRKYSEVYQIVMN